MSDRGPYRTEISVIIARAFVPPWIVLWFLMWLGSGMPFLGFFFGGFVSFIFVAIPLFSYLAAAWPACSLFGRMFFHDSEGYQQFLATGGSPCFDLGVPWPFNPDSWSVRCGGLPEPRTNYTPPTNHRFQCTNCGARNKVPGQCWNCGYQSNVVHELGIQADLRDPGFQRYLRDNNALENLTYPPPGISLGEDDEPPPPPSGTAPLGTRPRT